MDQHAARDGLSRRRRRPRAGAPAEDAPSKPAVGTPRRRADPRPPHEQVDVLGELITLCALRGSLDLRCQMAGDYLVDHPASAGGEAVFHMVLAGSCLVSPADGPSFVAASGALVLFPRGGAHRLSSTAPVRGRAWHSRAPGLHAAPWPAADVAVEVDLLCGRFRYDTAAAPILFDALPGAMHVPADTGDGGAGPISRLIRAEAEAARPAAVEVVTALTTALLVMALRRHLDTPQLGPGMLALLADRALAPSLVAMFGSPARRWTVAALAARTNMSRATFARRFAAVAGQGPAEILLAVRCHLALEMLRASRLSVGEIAAAVGYRSESAFGKAFARRIGVTPALVRRRWAQGDRRGASPSGATAPSRGEPAPA
ncbi:RCS-specific HTH-type transcriptional activator RclR [Rhodoplanes serenus]|uniref:RCS-specific HTH-type transcriptional activator RclR n=1 Tax=Rhodoplanes serenus TaxID=200615 RepID=A0A447CSZ4_9BRAD|nr:AraC family transcriptional regulator [Rhodoplanes serenus]VCU08340.1 RCS-specific HTH-type transcriptional activator RclR [Rhodoplanes serenus]